MWELGGLDSKSLQILQVWTSLFDSCEKAERQGVSNGIKTTQKQDEYQCVTKLTATIDLNAVDRLLLDRLLDLASMP